MSSSTSMDISETFRPEDITKTDFFDFVSAPDLGINIERAPDADNNTAVEPLQGYDQFWGAEKDSNRLDTAIFEDLNRYCWNQQTTNVSNSYTQQINTDGQIYTLTVLNGSETWLKKDSNENTTTTSSLDLDALLGNFPVYVKSEYSYDDSGFSTEHKDELLSSNSSIVTNLNSPNLSSYQNNNNNNNDWHIADHNNTEHDSAESLLRSALQGKGYTKGLSVQNGISSLPPHSLKIEDSLRRVMYVTDQESLAFADSTLTTPLFDDHHTPTNNSPNPSNSQSSVGVDEILFTLDSSFPTSAIDEYEKINRIATEVQQYCNTGEPYTDPTVVQLPLQQQTPTSSVCSLNPVEVVSTSQTHSISTSKSKSSTSSSSISSSQTKTPKKYKRSSSNNINSSTNNNTNNNNNNSITNNNNNNSTSNTTSSNNSPTQCNGQRKERSLHYCSICAKGFKDKYSVNVHIRTHTGEKPFACSLCGKSFRQKAHLAKHYQTHLAQKNPTGVVKGGKGVNNNNNNNNNHSSNSNGGIVGGASTIVVGSGVSSTPSTIPPVVNR